jgi:RNA polymerase sigma-70 factor, ECF subfamily
MHMCEQGDSLLAEAQALQERLAQGDQNAFQDIFRAYYGRVFGLACRLLGSPDEADDVAQETFWQLYRRPLPRGREHNLLAWLLTVATRLSYNALRAGRRRQARENRTLPDADRAGQADVTEQAEAAARIRQVLGRLPERQSRLILLRQAGLSYAEIASAEGVSPGSVGTLLARSERAFQELYQSVEEEENGRPKPLP